MVPAEKLRDYALNPAHPTGRHKARVFLAALGIGQPDWEFLGGQILERVGERPVTALRPKPPYGVEYEIRIDLDGRNGETHRVITGWHVPRRCAPAHDRIHRDRSARLMRQADGIPILWCMLSELDVIELKVAVDAWEAGTIATVLETDGPSSVLAEVADAEGRTLDTLVVPLEAARLVEPPGISGHSRTFPDKSLQTARF